MRDETLPIDPTPVEAWVRGNDLSGLSTRISRGDEMFGYIEGFGVDTAIHYLQSGLHTLEHIRRITDALEADTRLVLDFACGWGRTTRFLAHHFGPDRVHASDIAEEAVAFVGREFGVRSFRSAADPDDVKFPEHYDLIWVGSLFTHLPKPTFRRWLQKLVEQLTPNGVLAFTTSGPEVLGDDSRVADDDGFVFVPSSETERLEGEQYGSTFLTHDIVRREAEAAGACATHSFARCLWSIQDLHVCSRSELAGLDQFRPASLLGGSIAGAEVDDDGTGRVAGSVIVTRPFATPDPLTAVRIGLAGRPLATIAPTHTGTTPLDGADVYDWYLDGPLPADAPRGRQVLTATACTAGGRERTVAVTLIDLPQST